MGKTSKHIELIKNQLDSILDGCFSILLIGERGTGKSYLVNNKGITVKSSFELKQALEKKEEKPIIVDLIEYISFDEQQKMFDLISTSAFNKLNFDNNITCPQLIFTTQRDLSSLYQSEDFFKPFIDRIAQQIIKLPAIRNLSKEEIESCLESVNALMFPDGKSMKLDLELSKFIVKFIKEDLNLYGNFRDLGKASYFLWRFYQNTKDNKDFSKKILEEKLLEFKKINDLEIGSDFLELMKLGKQ
ncbi:MAG: ATP-binding protein [Bacteroidetes bacterium]|nr:ATP-binding protein [Bacteroidota bacterium]